MHATQYYPVFWLIKISHILGIILFAYMPWFFFKAGMFFKTKTLHTTIIHSSKRLLVPWLIFGCFGLIIQSPIEIHLISNLTQWLQWASEITVSEMALPGNPAMWFLSSLFFCHILIALLQKLCRYWVYVSMIIGFFMAIFFLRFPPQLWNKTLLFPNIFMGLFFFACGYLFKTKQYTVALFISSILLLIILSFFDTAELDVRINGGANCPILSYILFYARALCAILIINYIASKLPEKYLSNSIISYIGRNSMGYYVLHMPIMLLCKIVLLHVPSISFETQCLIMLSVIIVTLPIADILLRKYWPEALGLKRNKKRMSVANELP